MAAIQFAMDYFNLNITTCEGLGFGNPDNSTKHQDMITTEIRNDTEFPYPEVQQTQN